MNSELIDYWNGVLKDSPKSIDLLTDFPRSSNAINNREVQKFGLPFFKDCLRDLQGVNAVKRDARILLAAYSILLSRYADQDEILLGVIELDSSDSKLVSSISLCNSTVLKIAIEDDEEFPEYFERINNSLEKSEKLKMPLKYFYELESSQSLNKRFFFSAIFLYSKDEVSNEFLNKNLVGNSDITADFVMCISQDNETIKGNISYNKDLFQASTIERILTHYQTLIKSLISTPSAKPCSINMLPDKEYEQLVYGWNDRKGWIKQKKSLHKLFEDQAKFTPDSIAVIYKDQTLLYSQLNELSSLMADYLIGKGVQVGDRVGICMGRSIEVIVSILGILKTGASYVPLDISYPKARLEYILENSRIAFLLVKEEIVFDPIHINCEIIDIVKESFSIYKNRPISFFSPERQGDEAYLIYTSGSTGNPKGVVISHYTIANYILNHNKFASVTNADVQLQFASISFDVSIMEIFSPLLSGGCCVLIDDPATSSMQKITLLIESHKITSVFLPPAYWVPWLEYLIHNKKKLPACITRFYIGADKIEPYMIELWEKTCDADVDLFNGYGPTEATICATSYKFNREKMFEVTGRVPIGTAVGNAKIYILDKNRRPVPIGVPGEIYIGGCVLAKGYFGDQVLTDKKFILNPFTQDPNEKMYSSGDRARYLQDGNIEFLGRIDHQIKINGFRIEIGEIEKVISNLDYVIETAVIAAKHYENSDKFLVAFVITKSNESEISLSGKIKNFLKSTLPQYMIPSLIIPLDAMPLTPNGKVDRIKLESMSYGPSHATLHESPREDIERIVAEIWAKVLKIHISDISLDSDFIELGGSSINLVVIITMLQQRFVTSFDPQDIFERGTITVADISKIIQEKIFT